jgi:hypothetical protein
MRGLLVVLAVMLTGCGVFAVEGGPCNVNTECPTPEQDLVCFYGVCRRTCLADAVCSAGQVCSCSAGQAPFEEGGRHPKGPFGVCSRGCSVDADCAPARRCRFLTAAESRAQGQTPVVPTNTVCVDAPAVCGADGQCHASCGGPEDFCNEGGAISLDRCLPTPTGFSCHSESVCRAP